MYEIGDDIAKSIERTVGLPIDQIRALQPFDELAHIKKFKKKSVVFSSRSRKGVYGRGNPLLARKKYRTIEYVNDKLDSIKL